MKCYICKHDQLVNFLSLGHQPPSDAFLGKEDLSKEETAFPLDLFFCPNCSLVQLGYAVDPEKLFRDYVYTTGTNNALKANFKELIEKLISTYHIQEGALAIDIGSNDGTLLENYLPYKIKILGIDPSSSASIAIEKGIPTIVDFFNKTIAEKALSENGKAKVITATNVFAHVVDLDSFMEGITTLLSEDGIFVSESAYVVDMLEHMSYDQIYHEHLRYYGIKPLMVLFEKYGMEVINIERIASHGGSIRVYAAKKDALTASPVVSELLSSEKNSGYWEIEKYQNFSSRVKETKMKLLSIIFDLKKANKRIVGIGAPAKGNTLLNYCKLDPDMIDYLTEKSQLKIGLFSPGMHLPVVDEARLFTEQPEFALLLSWNLTTELVPKLRKLGYMGKFITPNPVPAILTE